MGCPPKTRRRQKVHGYVDILVRVAQMWLVVSANHDFMQTAVL